MKNLKLINVIFLAVLFGFSACSKEEEPLLISDSENEQLKFTASKNQNGTVLFSEWIPSEFPNSSLNGGEFFSLPMIKKDYFDINKDLIIFYGKRNSISQLPVTIPTSSESYMVELFPGTKGTIPFVRVTSLNWATEALQDIFFRPAKKAMFRVVIISGEKLLSLKSAASPDFEKMSYEEIAAYFDVSSETAF